MTVDCCHGLHPPAEDSQTAWDEEYGPFPVHRCKHVDLWGGGGGGDQHLRHYQGCISIHLGLIQWAPPTFAPGGMSSRSTGPIDWYSMALTTEWPSVISTRSIREGLTKRSCPEGEESWYVTMLPWQLLNTHPPHTHRCPFGCRSAQLHLNI